MAPQIFNLKIVIGPETRCVQKGTMSREVWDAPTALMNEISFLPPDQCLRAWKRLSQKSLRSSLFQREESLGGIRW